MFTFDRIYSADVEMEVFFAINIETLQLNTQLLHSDGDRYGVRLLLNT